MAESSSKLFAKVYGKDIGVLKCQGHDIHVPRGTEISNVADIEVHPEDVGNSLQSLEFCATFGVCIEELA
ncbi:hypothetical protein Ancab_034726 [Ancistrocladus abbreviatus]